MGSGWAGPERWGRLWGAEDGLGRVRAGPQLEMAALDQIQTLQVHTDVQQSIPSFHAKVGSVPQPLGLLGCWGAWRRGPGAMLEGGRGHMAVPRTLIKRVDHSLKGRWGAGGGGCLTILAAVGVGCSWGGVTSIVKGGYAPPPPPFKAQVWGDGPQKRRIDSTGCVDHYASTQTACTARLFSPSWPPTLFPSRTAVCLSVMCTFCT